MAEVRRNKERERHIEMEIVVDAYDEYERAIGWYCYLEQKLHFPFAATCISKRAISPLQIKDKVEVVGMAPDEECAREIFVMIRWTRDGLAVPLSQLRPAKKDTANREPVKDWHYWVQQGYEF